MKKKLLKKIYNRRKEIDNYNLSGRDDRLQELGWIQYYLEQNIKEDIPKWVMVDKYDKVNTSVWHNEFINVPFKVKNFKDGVYEVSFNRKGSWFITKDSAIIPTESEIEAHKLGFHIGSEVLLKDSFVKRVIKSFEKKESEQLRAWFTNGLWSPVRKITKEKPLMLGDYDVEIINEFDKYKTLIKVNGMFLSKESWLKCMNVFIPVISKNEVNEFNIDIGKHYEVNYELLNSGQILLNGINYNISIEDIDNITIEQIQAVTDRLNLT